MLEDLVKTNIFRQVTERKKDLKGEIQSECRKAHLDLDPLPQLHQQVLLT